MMDRKDRHGKGIAFSITFVKSSKAANSGGEIMHIHKAILAKNAIFLNSALRGQNRKPRSNEPRKSMVRNIISIDDNGYYKPHVRLITHVNDEPIEWQ